MRRSSLGVLLCVGLWGCPTSGDPWADARFEPLAGEGGVALFAELPDGDWTLEDGDGRAVALAPTGVTVDPDGDATTVYRLTPGDGESVEFTPLELGLTDASTPSPALLLADEALTLDLTLEAGDATLVRGDLLIRRVNDGGESSYLDPGCVDDATLPPGCWVDDVATLATDLGATDLAAAGQQLPPYTPTAGEPRAVRFGLFLRVDDGEGNAALLGGENTAVFLGRSLVYGDLHAHSNLSPDGCEDDEAGCADRGEGPAEDFFDNAVAAGLDFAALTDHAETHVLQTDGEAPIEIWPYTLDIVDDALSLEEAGFIPMLGYEWSNTVEVWEFMDPEDSGDDYRDELTAGHKTVLFRQAAACADYRVGAPRHTVPIVKGASGQIYTHDPDAAAALTTGEFREAMEQAALVCGEQTWMTFFHHPGYLIPAPVDWALPDNEPDPDHERLLEIASEHGSSECRDPSLDGCGFWVDEMDFHQHMGWGSAQEALSLGHRLGFLGGTDSHDSRPGSLDDGPGAIGIFHEIGGSEDDPPHMWHSGAITGAYLAGELDRISLWDALWARNTLATTGPRGRLAVAAVTADGLVALPGDEVPADAFPLTLLVAVQPDEDVEVERVEVIEPDGGTALIEAEGEGLAATLEDPGADAVYVRARIWDGGDEHRVWFSPLFVTR